MKNILLISLVLIILCGCSQSSKKDNRDQTVEVAPKPAEAPPTDYSEFLDHPVLKEQLFFYLRSQFVNMDENTFVKYEHLEIDKENFSYSTVITDVGMLVGENQINHSSLIHLAAYSSQDTDQYDLGDSISIEGKLDVLETVSSGNEGQVTSIKLNITAEYATSYVQSSPYSYGGYERIHDGYDIAENLIVKLDEPIIYDKEQMHLKARIHVLTENDVKGYSNDELAYLRNELFARHGHTFKTEKMQSYFAGENWYVAYFEDATPFLNEIEKQNALFIKSLES